MSLIEVLVASGLMALVAAGLIGTITSMNKEQNNQIRQSTLRELKTRFQFLITDQNSWNRTIQNNPNMACIRLKAACPVGIFDLNLYDSGGAIYFTPPPFATPLPGAGSPGFSDKGTICNVFNGNAGAGVVSCPITFKVVWEPVCSVACKNPLVKVTVRMMYNTDVAASQTALSIGDTSGVGTGVGGWTDDTNPVKTGKYDVVIKRSSTNVSKSFDLAIEKIGTAVNSPGGGACAISPAVSIRGANTNTNGTANPPWIEKNDLFDLVTFSVTTGIITIMPGTYNCKITAVAWAVDSFQIQLRQVSLTPLGVVTGSIGSSNASTSSYAQAVATSNPILNIGAATDFQVEQSCQNPTWVSAAPNGRQYTLGMPATPYGTSSTLATFTCTQTN